MAGRPRRVTILAGFVFFLAGVNGARVVIGWRALPLLRSLPLTVPPWYAVASGAWWGALGLFLAWGLWTLRPWAVGLTRVAALVYVGWSALDRFVLAAPAWRRLGVGWFAFWAVAGLAWVFYLTAGDAAH